MSKNHTIHVDSKAIEKHLETHDHVMVRYMCQSGFIKETKITKAEWLGHQELSYRMQCLPKSIRDQVYEDEVKREEESVKCDMVGIVDESDRTATDFDKKIFEPTLEKEVA